MTQSDAAKLAHKFWGNMSFVRKLPDTPLHKAFCEVGILVECVGGFGSEVYGYGWKFEDAFADAKQKGHCK